jgi:GMP synthase-like glutamine amidotransferase
VRLLLVLHHEVDGLGLLDGPFRQARFAVDEWLLPASADRRVDVTGYQAVVVLGSPDSVYGDEAAQWIGTELATLRDADAHAVPVLGICFGAQSLCTALGGRVEPAPAEELGWTTIEVEPDAGLDAGPWFQHHGDRCLLPDGVEVLASTPIAVQAYRAGPHLGVQFHPEVDAGQLHRWYDAGVRQALVGKAVDPDELLAATRAEEPSARRRAASLVAMFLQGAGLG